MALAKENLKSHHTLHTSRANEAYPAQPLPSLLDYAAPSELPKVQVKEAGFPAPMREITDTFKAIDR